jgi:DNA replication licensing factor MCM3
LYLLLEAGAEHFFFRKSNAMTCILLQVLKIDVEAALQVLNFAIFHKELTDMEDREQKEMEKQQAENEAAAGADNADGHGDASGNGDENGG